MSTISPNMNLIVPTAGVTPGPTFAFDINSSLSVIDSHDHTPGKGVAISVAGINIDANLPFNNFFATQLAGATFLSQLTPPTLSTVYVLSDDLYYVDGLGNNIRLTQNGGVAGTAGSISNLVAPATAAYVPGSSKFVWQSNTSIAADMDFGAAIMRNLSPNSTYALTLQPPTLSANYSITLPSLPSTQSFMTLDNAGVMSAPWTVDNTTIKIVANQLVAQTSTTSPYREHAWELNGPYYLLTYPLENIDSLFLAPVNITIQSVWIYNGTAGSTSGLTEFDLKVANPGGSWTSILSTTGKINFQAAANIWTDSGSVVAAQTGVVKPVIGTAAITAGQALRFDLLQTMGGTPTDARIRIYYTLA